jgi:hypothetical protein
MTQLIGNFPIVEWAVIGWLKLCLPENFIVTGTLPSDFATPDGPPRTDNPIILVEQIPGGGGIEIERDVDFDVTVFALTKTLAWVASQPVETALAALPGRGPIKIDDLEERSHFGYSPYANTNVKRLVATYRATVRPQ